VADVAAIRSALASRLSTLVGTGGQSSGYMLDNPTPPTLHVVGISETEYDVTFGRGSDVLTMVVQGLAGTTSDRASQEKLDEWLDTSGSTSVKAALETERPAPVTLGGIVSSCRVVGTTGHRIYRMSSGTDLFGAEWTIEIIT
jgi:hypothetical protein